jgi:curved DNA-binding protein CbpA
MSSETQTIERLKKAYRVLNVPEAASALAIKASYRKLIKRWHPDKPATSAATQDESVMMTKLINEAYTLIENAPLRYFDEKPATSAAEKSEGRIEERRGFRSLKGARVALIEKRVEYAVRIGCGMLSGAFIGLLFGERLNDENVFTGVLICALLFAAGAVKVGDKFWRKMLGIWWRWE